MQVDRSIAKQILSVLSAFDGKVTLGIPASQTFATLSREAKGSASVQVLPFTKISRIVSGKSLSFSLNVESLFLRPFGFMLFGRVKK